MQFPKCSETMLLREGGERAYTFAAASGGDRLSPQIIFDDLLT